jgi:hypothetical protein
MSPRGPVKPVSHVKAWKKIHRLQRNAGLISATRLLVNIQTILPLFEPSETTHNTALMPSS